MRLTRREWIRNGLLLAASSIISLATIEGVVAFVLWHPRIMAADDGSIGRALALTRSYYMRNDRRIVQLLPGCARYDPQVTYTLIPGARCTVVNREHSVEYAANRVGLRDDDGALANPAIVVIGDSHAMGWGVAASDSFPKVMQHDLGIPVLNAAMSSYGTARELALLERLRLPGFKVLVIQYCDNDFNENKYLVDHGALQIQAEPRYRAWVDGHVRNTRYYPFKHVRNLFSSALALPWSKAPPRPDTNAAEAGYFLEVLLRYNKLIEGKTVVVIELNENNQNDDRFTQSLTALLDQPRYAGLKRWVAPVDVSKALTAADYYVLDDHMTPTGHAKVAQVVERELERRGALRR